MSAPNSQASSEISLTYKYLLTFSTLSAVCFCWLYITKPTEIKTYSTQQENNNSAAINKEELLRIESNKNRTDKSSFDGLNGSNLPGDSPQIDAISPTDISIGESTIPLAENDSTRSKIGYEETNDRIQHVITAQSDSISERIVIEIPVIYQTRGLRLGPDQSKEAQRVLKALKIYQSQIKKLHLDGKNIQLAWNNLLIQSQPITSLRADSPSLPQNMPDNSMVLPENSAATIKHLDQ